ncbi:hypothetical protein, partial [Nevskia ramosa]|uniref:hypothetical protein n=1 Tax=Nevskia ramosa TaxID=64002 RepID=UPI00235461AE
DMARLRRRAKRSLLTYSGISLFWHSPMSTEWTGEARDRDFQAPEIRKEPEGSFECVARKRRMMKR